MEEKKKAVEAYFKQSIERCNEQVALLNQQDRRDEASFEKVRSNIYDIFHTMFLFALRTSNQESEKAVAEIFYQKVDAIPNNWKVSYQKAVEHGDEAKRYIEEIKLQVVEEIKEKFHQIWEES